MSFVSRVIQNLEEARAVAEAAARAAAARQAAALQAFQAAQVEARSQASTRPAATTANPRDAASVSPTASTEGSLGRTGAQALPPPPPIGIVPRPAGGNRAVVDAAVELLSSGISASALAEQPALREAVRQALALGDPRVAIAANTWAKDLVTNTVKEVVRDRDERATTPEALRDDIGEALRASAASVPGLGKHLQSQSRNGIREAARDALRSLDSPRDLERAPARGALVAALASSSDSDRDDLQDALEEVTQKLLDDHLTREVKGPEAVARALEAFKDDLADLARRSGLGEVLQDAAEEVLREANGRIQDQAKPEEEGGNFFTRAVGSLADALGDLAGGLADLVTDPIGTVRQAIGDVIESAGDVASTALDLGGDALDLGLDAVGTVGGGVLDAVGADGVADGVRHVADEVGDGIDGGLDIASNVVDATTEVVGALVADGPTGAANELADQLLGPVVPAYANQIPGITGAITNRLDTGEGAFLTGRAGIKIPSQTVAAMFTGWPLAPNLEGKFEASAQIQRNEDGTIGLQLSVRAEGGASLEASASGGANFQLGGNTYGVQFGAEASIGVTAQASAQVNLVFDPNNPGDVARLRAIIEPEAIDLLSPLAFAVNHGSALVDAIQNNRESFSVGADFGVSASVKAEVEAGEVEDPSVAIAQQKLTGLTLGGTLSGSLEAGAHLGFTQYADGSHEVDFDLSGPTLSTRLELSGAFATGTRSMPAESFHVRRGEDGRIVGVSADATLVEGVNAREDHKDTLRPESERTEPGLPDAQGKPTLEHVPGLNSVSSSLSGTHEVRTTVNTALNEAGLVELNRLVNQGMPVELSFQQLIANPDFVTITQRTRTTDSFSIGAGVNLSTPVGAIDLSVGITAGRFEIESTEVGPSRIGEMNHDTRDRS